MFVCCVRELLDRPSEKNALRENDFKFNEYARRIVNMPPEHFVDQM